MTLIRSNSFAEVEIRIGEVGGAEGRFNAGGVRVTPLQHVDRGAGEVDAHQEAGCEALEEEANPSAGTGADVENLSAIDGDFEISKEPLVDRVEHGVFDGVGIDQAGFVLGDIVELFPGLFVVLADVFLHEGHGFSRGGAEYRTLTHCRPRFGAMFSFCGWEDRGMAIPAALGGQFSSIARPFGDA